MTGWRKKEEKSLLVKTGSSHGCSSANMTSGKLVLVVRRHTASVLIVFVLLYYSYDVLLYYSSQVNSKI